MIFINQAKQQFHLQTAHSSYIFHVAETGHLVNLYYGARLSHRDDFSVLDQRLNVLLGSSTAYADNFGSLSLDTLRLEVASYGKGDYREPQLHIEYEDDGSRTSDFLFHRYELHQHKPELIGLPATELSSQQACSLTLVLREPIKKIELHLHYSCFEVCDVISRSLEIINNSENNITLDSALSLCMDLPDDQYDLLHLSGKWINEAQLQRHPLARGVFKIDSKKGVSSADHNPFMALTRPNCSETDGECYGFGLVYSGNHQCSVEVSPHNMTRVMLGISPFDFRWSLAKQEKFTCPEVLMTYSKAGLNGMSQHFHHAIQQHLIPVHWHNRPRPIQVNNWEATYFDFDEKKLLKLAKKAKQLGIELFVLDDGWFGQRDSDTTSLGDYFEHSKKLPHGLAHLSEKIKALGLQFGIWVEPEMISPTSELYKKHPEWTVQSPQRSPSLGRHQLLLDMSNPQVVEYLYQQLKSVFKRANVDYVKWDHNRNFSDIYSACSSKAEQGGFAHRYVLGLYRLLHKLKADFPEVLFESCSSGGNRFDLGMLHYMPQTWTSDNTDAVARTKIQYGSSLLYPLSSMSAHVSGRPSHQVLRQTSIETRFNVAAFGCLGYQTDITKLTPFESKAVMAQINFYKQHRQLLQFGRFYRLQSPFEDNRMLWIVVNQSGDEAILGYYQTLQQSNGPLEQIRVSMLDPDRHYQINNRVQFENIRQYGDLINEQLPVAIKDRGLIHSVLANHYQHQVTAEHYQLYGDQLSGAGLPLKSQFTGTDMTEQVRHIGDFGSRLYHFKSS